MNGREALVGAAVIGLLAGCAASGSHPSRTAAGAAPTTAVPTTLEVTVPPTTVAPTTTTTTPPTTAAAATSTTKVAAAAPTSSTSATTSDPCPSGLASELASTGSARQLVTVEAAGWDTSYATVELWQRQGRCWVSAGGPWAGRIGENGFSDHHIEGDGTSPTGIYGLGPVMYGNAPDPGVHETYHDLVCGDWWDEDPNSPGYNTFQHVPCGQTPSFAGGSEALWTETAPYPSFAVIDYNTGPIVKGAGSGIFFHRDTGQPTVGCVSVPLADLDQALRWLQPSENPAFVMGPAQEITRF